MHVRHSRYVNGFDIQALDLDSGQGWRTLNVDKLGVQEPWVPSRPVIGGR